MFTRPPFRLFFDFRQDERAGDGLESFRLIERVRRGVADARHVGKKFSGAPLGHDAHEQLVASPLHDFDFDARKLFLELA